MPDHLSDSRRFLLCLCASAALHIAVLALPGLDRLFGAVVQRPAPLHAVLTPAARNDTRPAEPVLKDTLAPAEPKAALLPPPESRERPAHRAATAPRAAQRRLAEPLYYPPEAVARGIEGEVRLLLTLDADGRVLDARIAAGSGHAILDEAAVRAAYAMGRLAGVDQRELILPVVFRLQ